MPTFAYTGRTRAGETVSGERVADSIDAATAALRREQINVTRITPAKAGFGNDDAAFLEREGFNLVRLGVVFGSVMPQPGVIDQRYVAGIAHTTDALAVAICHLNRAPLAAAVAQAGARA